MSHAIIRGKSGRRHEVDFEGCALRVEVYASDETVEIFVEADTAELPEERRRFALVTSLATCSARRPLRPRNEKNEGFGSGNVRAAVDAPLACSIEKILR